MYRVKIIIIFIFILLLTIVILQNQASVTIYLLWWKVDMLLFAIPVISVFSIAIGYLLATMTIHKRNKNKQLQSSGGEAKQKRS